MQKSSWQEEWKHRPVVRAGCTVSTQWHRCQALQAQRCLTPVAPTQAWLLEEQSYLALLILKLKSVGMHLLVA